jgi:hypothetical protein
MRDMPHVNVAYHAAIAIYKRDIQVSVQEAFRQLGLIFFTRLKQ